MTQYKTEESAQFCQLFREYEAAGFNQSDLAREMKMDKSTVSNWLKGRTPVPESRLAVFQGIMEKLRLQTGGMRYPEHAETVVGIDEPDVRTAANSLREIHEADPQAFREVERVIITYRKALKPKPKPETKPSSSEASRLKAAVAAGVAARKK